MRDWFFSKLIVVKSLLLVHLNKEPGIVASSQIHVYQSSRND